VRRKTIRKRMERSCARLSSNSVSACTIRCATPANGSSRSYKLLQLLCVPETSTVSAYSESVNWHWCRHFAAEARNAGPPGHVCSLWLTDGSLDRAYSILIPATRLPPVIRDKTGCANDALRVRGGTRKRYPLPRFNTAFAVGKRASDPQKSSVDGCQNYCWL